MTHYLQEITRIKNNFFANNAQLETVIGTRRFIESNFDRELNLNLLSHIGLTSKFHLLRLFKRYYGQTPTQYLIDRRIDQARKLLSKGAGVAETCYDIGFESPSSFSSLFKSRVGQSPTEFQKRATFAKSGQS